MEEQIMNMPAVALRGLTILPGMIAHFDISRERSLRAVEEAMEQDQKIYLVTQRNVDSEDPTQEDLYQMGIVADIKQVVRLQNDVVRILVDGISRAALLGFTGNEKYLEAEICYCDSNADSLPEDLREAMLLGVREAFHRYAAVVGKISKELIRQIDQYEDLEKLIDYVTNNLPVSYELKQRISLGGVRDEAEIRGHRKTYIGAMPGRIVNGLRQAGVSNPLMLLDEIDKVSSDYKGDTSAALLEVLDSEQNCRFRDHYIEMPVDLSEVLFIATANEVSGISKPLLDRMELIEVSSYTENEKFHIAKEHLIEKQKSKNGIKKEQLTITDSALKDIIRLYTREAGVRSLERTIGKLCRKAAREIFKDSEAAVKVTKTNLKTYLGNPKYSPEKKNDRAEVGIVRGLAWTSVGGVTLEVEVNVLPGKGELVLTGKLGDVMKESAQAALSYVRSISEGYGIDAEFYTKHDIHIHIPEGAVPKDGPSAGITMATAMLSAITDRAVRADVAMTGEITLRGRVLPIGGLKEKLLAAKVIGIKTVCIPKDNEKDLEEISKEITDGMEIVPVERFSQVEKIAFVK